MVTEGEQEYPEDLTAPSANPAPDGYRSPGETNGEPVPPEPALASANTDPGVDGGTMFYCTGAAILAWLIPGGGHAAIGEWRRAFLFAALIAGLFIVGIALDGKIYRIEEDDVLSYAASLGASGVGGPYVLGHVLGYGDGDERAEFHEYGSTFTLVAGLLNLLIILDAFDLALLRRRAALQAEPPGLEP